MKTAEVVYQCDRIQLIHDILGNEYQSIIVANLCIRELDLNDPDSQTNLEFDLIINNLKRHVVVNNEGAIACMFTGLSNTLSNDFKSLRRLSMHRFSTRVKKAICIGGSVEISADERISVEIKIACGAHDLYFEHVSRSLIKSAVVVVINAFEAFINAELAMIKLRRAYDLYIMQNRQDLIQGISNDMALLVQIMPYDDIISS